MKLINCWTLECIATTCSRRTIDQCIQEQTGQTLDGYGRMKVSAIQLIMDKYKYKYKYPVVTTWTWSERRGHWPASEDISLPYLTYLYKWLWRKARCSVCCLLWKLLAI